MPESDAVNDAPAVDEPVAAAPADGAPETDVRADAASDAALEAPPTPPADAQLVAAHDLALAGLKEITPASTIGPAAGYTVEADGVVSLRFENRLAGYPGWYWTVSLARVDGEEPTVLEAELLPGESALLAPEWVPWAVRLAEYRAQQAAAAAAAAEDGDDADGTELEEDDLDDIEDLDAADFDTDGSPILHAGDVDGVDIDELDEDADDADSDDDDEDDSDDEDSDDEDDSDDDDSDDEDDDSDED